jgi:hypothetical protein
MTQEIAKVVWEKMNRIRPVGVDLDFDHPMLCPVKGFAEMLVDVQRRQDGGAPGVIAIVAEEETLTDVTENINIARRLDGFDGITGILAAPHEFEQDRQGRTTYQGQPVSLVFMDFNNDVFLKLHRKHDLSPLMAAIRENRVLNPRGTEPINVKSMFEVITGPYSDRFHPETVARTPWTRRFRPRKATGPKGEPIDDLITWARAHWDDLVLKPERGYSGRGVFVGTVNPDADAAIETALREENYILQEKVPLDLWAEEIPELDEARKAVVLKRYQTDFRCLVGPDAVFGFLGRYGNVPTNVGSGGGVHPMGILRSDMSVRDAVHRINDAIMAMPVGDVVELVGIQKALALEKRFTYLLGPIRIALRPRVLTEAHLGALASYSRAMWEDSRVLEQMWFDGVLDDYIDIEAEELEIARSQPWKGSPAIFAADGLFSFGAHPEAP